MQEKPYHNHLRGLQNETVINPPSICRVWLPETTKTKSMKKIMR